MNMMIEVKENVSPMSPFNLSIILLLLKLKNFDTLFCIRREDVNTAPPIKKNGTCVLDERSKNGIVKYEINSIVIAKKDDSQLLNPKLTNKPIPKPNKAPLAKVVINERTGKVEIFPSNNIPNTPPIIIHNGIICA